MCLNPRTIINPSRHRGYLLHRHELVVACGKCSECRKQRELEWQHRAYSEYNYYSKNGFVLFQTLTYNEHSVPRIRNIGNQVLSTPLRVFDREHIRKFRSNLRDKIRCYMRPDGTKPFYDYYNKDNFKVLITSEYGGITHRPHYHCLFFNAIPGLTYGLLDYFIKQSWPHGFCDRSPVSKRIVNSTGVLSYVSKYISKDDDFVRTLESELAQSNVTCKSSSTLVRNVLPFHVQSQGFGLRIINDLGKDRIFKDGFIVMPDKQRIVSSIPIPMYLQRHIFYDLVDDSDNIDPISKHPRKRWILNDYGIKYKMFHLNEKLTAYATTLANNISNISSVVQRGFRSVVDDILNGRTLFDYAVYSLIFRGCRGTANISSYRLVYRSLLSSSVDSPFNHSTGKLQISSLPPLVWNHPHPTDSSLHIFDEFSLLDRLLADAMYKLNQYKLSKYYDIQRARSRLKLVTESYLINPHFYNSINYAKDSQSVSA